MTENVNGFNLLATYRPEALEGILPGRVILGERSYCGGHRREFVTAYLPDDEITWVFGHYFDNRLDASKDYAMRFERGL